MYLSMSAARNVRHVEIDGLLKHVAKNGHNRGKEIEVLELISKGFVMYVRLMDVLCEQTD